MLIVTRIAIKLSRMARGNSLGAFFLIGLVGLSGLAALTMTACSAPPLASELIPDDESQDIDRMPRRVPKASFYEDNPTYVSRARDDGFFRTATPASQHLDNAMLAQAAHVLSEQKSALSLLIIRNGYLVMERYFNGSHVTHSNNIHSASKSILSALIGIALDRGILKSLDQPLSELLPRHRMKDAATANIKLRHLLSMTSGLDWEEDSTEYTIEKKSDWVQAILDLPLKNAPGTKFNYCTGNTHLLSAILTEASGQATPEFAKEHLFRPLGVTFQHWGKDPQGIASGGYNVYMTPRALARFALMVHSHGKSAGTQIVPADWLANSLKPADPPEDIDYRYGYLYWLPNVAGRSVAKMWGFGGQLAYVLPDDDMIVVMTHDTSHEYPEPDGDEFLRTYILPAID